MKLPLQSMSRQPKILIDPENYISLKFKERIAQLIADSECKNNKDFAKLVGVSEPVITKAVNFGIIPTIKPLLNMANSLQLSFDYLIAKTDTNEFYPALQPTTFHVRLKQLKEENRTRWSEILFNLPFPRTYIYEWLAEGTYPCVDYLYAMTKAFRVVADYLLGRTDDRN